MLARAAMWNCSIFRKEGILSLDVVIKRFLELVSRKESQLFLLIKNFSIILRSLKALETDNFFFNTKYVIQNMLHEELQSTRGCAVLSSLCGEEL